MTAHLTRVQTRLAVHARRRVHGLLEGQHSAHLTGRSTEFTDLREYVRGDDVKDIDWKASARTRSLLVKRYAAERRHTVLLAVATGRGMAALTEDRVPKRDVAVLVAGVVGYLASRHGDLVSVVHGDAASVRQTEPSTRLVALERALDQAHDAATPQAAPGDLTALLDHVARTVRRRAILLVVTDEVEVEDRLRDLLRRLVTQHEVLLVTVADLDPTGPAAREALLDVDSGRAVPSWVAQEPLLRQEYADAVRAARGALRAELAALGIAHEVVPDEAGAVPAVLRLLERHRRARR